MTFPPQIPLPTTNLPILHHHIRLALLATAQGKSAFRVSTTLKALDGLSIRTGFFSVPNDDECFHDPPRSKWRMIPFRQSKNFWMERLYHCSMLLRLEGA